MYFRRNLSQSVETISVTSNFDGYSEVNQLKKVASILATFFSIIFISYSKPASWLSSFRQLPKVLSFLAYRLPHGSSFLRAFRQKHWCHSTGCCHPSCVSRRWFWLLPIFCFLQYIFPFFLFCSLRILSYFCRRIKRPIKWKETKRHSTPYYI